jgi:hypothetical protein
MAENEKSEIRSTKHETNSKYQNMNDQNKGRSLRLLIESLLLASKGIVLDFEHLNFGFVSDFDIRISDLNFLVLALLVCALFYLYLLNTPTTFPTSSKGSYMGL